MAKYSPYREKSQLLYLHENSTAWFCSIHLSSSSYYFQKSMHVLVRTVFAFYHAQLSMHAEILLFCVHLPGFAQQINVNKYPFHVCVSLLQFSKL